MNKRFSLLAGASIASIFASPVGPRIFAEPEGRSGGGDTVDAKKLAADLKAATDEVKSFAEKATTELKNLGKLTGETKEDADKALTELAAIKARVDEMEQKSVRPGNGNGAPEVKSWGQTVAESDEIKAYDGKDGELKAGDWRGRMSFSVKAVTSLSAGGATSVGTALITPDRLDYVPLPRRPMSIRGLVMPGRTNSGLLEYARQASRTLNAATVAENPSSPKPQSDLAWTLESAKVATIAHWILASKQILADAPRLQSEIDGELRYGLDLVEEAQLLLGDGTGTNLHGLIPQSTAYAAPAGVTVTGETPIDRLRIAMLQATLALFPADGHVLHPIDWINIELQKDTLGRYILSNPAGMVGPTLWGLPVAQSMSMPVGDFLTGAFRMAAQIFDREDANVLISTEDGNNFTKNMVTILAEKRLALVVRRPAALVYGSLPVPAGP